MKRLTTLVAAVGLIAGANAALFDFESSPGTSGGALSSLTVTDGGLSATITRSSGVGFDILDWTTPGSFDPSWGDRHLDPFAFQGTNDWFIADFSTAVSAVSLQMTDFGGDPDFAEMKVYSGLGGTGTLLGSPSFTWADTMSGPDFLTLAYSGAPALSIRFRGGSFDFPNSMYVDNIRATPVPEPFTMGLAGLALAAAARRRMRKSA